ncbi:chromate transporter [Desertibacillus haloalkaliphilus]|uniref:chromate transporter n=1 Tax=Desertibacillus haloalkaliphilus TaxID=1328930 RepID=UPI001C26E786|nr:chromate transporter [Desertibacillus haloalkaliphilus]MBU8908233.1 chromate transporter [Desertibacillus haloalkaliphilus]
MIYIEIFWAFFIANLLGYGGGPSTIPLIQNEVVDQYEWMSLQEFADLLAIANALPGPIATKMGGFIGYEIGGVFGAVLALIATVAPSAIAVIILFKFANKFKSALQVKFMTRSVQPVIAILLAVLAYQFFLTTFEQSGLFQLVLLTVVSYLALEKFKVHPAFVILGSLCYGALCLSGLVT